MITALSISVSNVCIRRRLLTKLLVSGLWLYRPNKKKIALVSSTIRRSSSTEFCNTLYNIKWALPYMLSFCKVEVYYHHEYQVGAYFRSDLISRVGIPIARAGMAIGSKLLSEQPARDRAEHGALRKPVHLKTVLVRVNTEQPHIINYYFTSAVFKLWYASL